MQENATATAEAEEEVENDDGRLPKLLLFVASHGLTLLCSGLDDLFPDGLADHGMP